MCLLFHTDLVSYVADMFSLTSTVSAVLLCVGAAASGPPLAAVSHCMLGSKWRCAAGCARCGSRSSSLSCR
jgi:hypothetical protein